MDKSLSISVIIPAFNADKYLYEAIQSIKKQTSPIGEIILVDDGSTDTTATIIHSQFPEVVYVKQENTGPAAARNKGLQIAKGPLIAFLDADDQWLPSKTALQLNAFQEDPSLEIVSGMTTYQFMPESMYRKELYRSAEKKTFHILLSSVIVKKSVFEKTGLLDETLQLSEDQDWFMKVRELGIKTHIIDEVVLQYRIHEKGITANKGTKSLGILQALKKSLDRRRETGKNTLDNF
ncbi:glycosyltransferase family A protein [Algivirga pacifica]